MGAFSMYIRVNSDEVTDPADADKLLDRYVEAYESVSHESAEVDAGADPGVIVPEKALDIDDIDDFAAIFEELRDSPAVHDISLWGPGSTRFPLRVYHHALRNLSDPDSYQFHAIDNRETLLICDSPGALERAREEIGPAGLVEGGKAKF